MRTKLVEEKEIVSFPWQIGNRILLKAMGIMDVHTTSGDGNYGYEKNIEFILSNDIISFVGYP
jgi:hypothetical protein